MIINTATSLKSADYRNLLSVRGIWRTVSEENEGGVLEAMWRKWAAVAKYIQEWDSSLDLVMWRLLEIYSMQIWSIKEKWRERNWRVLEMFLDIFLQGEKRNSDSEIGSSIFC